MRQLIVDAITGSTVTSGAAHRDTQGSSRLECLIHSLHRLAGPARFRPSPTDGNHRRVIRSIVGRLGNCIKEAAIGIRREVNGDACCWCNAARDFNVKGDFAIGAIWVSYRSILPTIDRHTDHLRRRNTQLLKVGGEILVVVASPKFNKRYTLAAPIKAGWKVIELGNLWRSIGGRHTRLRLRRRADRVAQMRLGLRPVIKAKNTHNDLIKFTGDV